MTPKPEHHEDHVKNLLAQFFTGAVADEKQSLIEKLENKTVS
tara:strand:+ start:423 stop:548 length:126 start_codon:yes stop_codon:yes gene_type:complete